MALASVFGTNLFKYEPGGVIDFYDGYPVVRESFAQAAAWTGIDVELLLRQNAEHADQAEQIRVASIGLAAAQLGIQDVLVAKGLRPAMVGGLSLGGLVGACVAGAVGRRDLMELLARGEHRPERDDADRAEGIASAYLARDADPESEVADRDGVYVSSDFGTDADGRIRIVMLSGYRDALEKYAAEQPDGMVTVTEGADLAVHCPLRETARQHSRPHIDALTFSDPVLPVCSCLEQRTLRTADEVRAMFVDNVVRPISLVHVNQELKRHGAQLALVVGPSPVMNALRYPFPAVFVDSPAALPRAVAAVFEHGVAL
ncbi:acyltransferase domain-containing protein [Micromonospora sp. DT233]|uniref:acyltransferase domain-containing protein n=1 Tax=Micromonospora sp. DT233 TaxID=3393432 RepID=UPI003CF525BD